MEKLNALSSGNILSLLQETNEEALKTNKGSYEQWLRVRDEHTTLLGFLETLPGVLSYDVLVPFGCRALMRGKLVHTNEILVRLGDGWFVKCSAKHAADICSRRITLCKEMLEKLEKEREFLLSRKELPMQQEAFGSREQAEIIETYSEEEEAEWRVRHREKERQYRQKLAEVRKREKQPLIEEEDIWQRLDELELEEELQEELDRLHAEDGDYDEDDDVDYGEEVETVENVNNSDCISGIHGGSGLETVNHSDNASETEVKESGCRRVSFPDSADVAGDNGEVKRRKVSFSDKPKDIDSDDSEEDSRIEFFHTLSSGTEPSEHCDSNIISCPADIFKSYRRVHGKTAGLKSILKKSTSSLDEATTSNDLVSPSEVPVTNGTEDVLEDSLIEAEVLPPVVGEVVERKVQEPQPPAQLEKRPVSKFKAARQSSRR
ncbi:unconventional prefoldin RPB5 interactor-like protein [Bacillus rossius redtenbacheri]|uniref:unconventional prefoldin RPB5 interactor-like protein n=1 Tax=Bacillus rossius redtenbacheri TaxID=93214 RepID=UPI002FDE18C0